LLILLREHRELGILSQIDYDKFYLYSIIAHSTAIEGSTVTEVEAQLLFDEGITSSKRTMMEQMEWGVLPTKVLIDQFLQSTGEKMVDKQQILQDLMRKWSIKPSLAAKLADMVVWMMDKDEITTEQLVAYYGYAPTTAKRYLRQLTQFGYLEQRGSNRNRTYCSK